MKRKALLSILLQVRCVFLTTEPSMSLEKKPQNTCVISEYSILDKTNISWALNMNISALKRLIFALKSLCFIMISIFCNNFLNVDFSVSNFSAASFIFHLG